MSELQAFITSRAGTSGWRNVTRTAGLGERNYLAHGSFPDTEATAILASASTELSLPQSELLRAFGQHLVTPFFDTYRRLLRPEWRTLDVLIHTESVLHDVVARTQPGAHPPALLVVPAAPFQVVVHYRSVRRMCHLAVGIIEGLSEWFNEPLQVTQRRCMLEGDPECQLVVTMRPPSGMHRRPSL